MLKAVMLLVLVFCMTACVEDPLLIIKRGGNTTMDVCSDSSVFCWDISLGASEPQNLNISAVVVEPYVYDIT